MRETGPSERGATARCAPRILAAMDPWERAGVTHEEWVAARLKVAALARAIDEGDPEAVAFVMRRRDGETGAES